MAYCLQGGPSLFGASSFSETAALAQCFDARFLAATEAFAPSFPATDFRAAAGDAAASGEAEEELAPLLSPTFGFPATLFLPLAGTGDSSKAMLFLPGAAGYPPAEVPFSTEPDEAFFFATDFLAGGDAAAGEASAASSPSGAWASAFGAFFATTDFLTG